MNLNKFILNSFATVFFSLAAAQSANAGDLGQKLDDMKTLLSNGALQGMVAKELCSCRYVSGLTMDQCKDKSSLLSQVFLILSVDDYQDQKVIVVTPKLVTQLHAEARFNSADPKKGCRITFGRLNYK